MAMIASRRGPALPDADLPPWTRDCAIGWLLVAAPLAALLLEQPFVPDSLDVTLFGSWAAVPFFAGLAYAMGIQFFVGDAARHAAARDTRRGTPGSYRVLMFVVSGALAGFATHRLVQCIDLASAPIVQEEARVDMKWTSTGKGCHEHVRLTGATHWRLLQRCVSPARYQQVTVGMPVTLDLRIGAVSEAVTAVRAADGSPL